MCTTRRAQKTLFISPPPKASNDSLNFEEGGAGDKTQKQQNIKTLFISQTPVKEKHDNQPGLRFPHKELIDILRGGETQCAPRFLCDLIGAWVALTIIYWFVNILVFRSGLWL